jgi:hypothetical protein
MNKAPFIGSGIVYNYDSRAGVPYTTADIPDKQRDKRKDPDNPTSEYHEWLKTFEEFKSLKFTREQLIDPSFVKIQEKEKEKKVDAKKTKKKPKKKRAAHYIHESESEVSEASETAVGEAKIESESDDDAEIEDDTYDEKNILSSETKQPEVSNHPRVVTADQNPIEIKNTEVFEVLASISWSDESKDQLDDKCFKRTNVVKLGTLYPQMLNLAKDLKDSIIANTHALDGLSADEVNNFLFRVIAKGREFYFMSITDPGFCIYLIDCSNQPLYTLIKRKCGL